MPTPGGRFAVRRGPRCPLLPRRDAAFHRRRRDSDERLKSISLFAALVKAATPEEDGSWWLAWFDWLARHSSGERAADRAAPPAALDSAPGSYVLQP